MAVSKHFGPISPPARNNSYRNLASCCRDCNAQKGQCRAKDFLRSLFRDRKLTERELASRLRALDALAAGKLPPPLAAVVGAGLAPTAFCQGKASAVPKTA